MFFTFYDTKVRKTGGMTLVEVTIAIALAAIVSLGMYGSAVYTRRQAAKNTEQVTGVQLVNAAAAKARCASFAKIAANDRTGLEQQFWATTPIKADSIDPKATSYNITYDFKGFGTGVAAVSGNDFILSIPTQSASWAADEFKGHYLVITGGKGVNQARYIVSHEASTGTGANKKVKVKLAFNFDGTGAVAWGVTPDSTSQFCIDYGLYCTIVCKWGTGDEYRTIQETAYVSGQS